MLRRIIPFSDEKVSIIHFFNFRLAVIYLVIGFESGFSGLLDYMDYLALSVGLGVLNQDFQDFEDF